MKTGEDGEWRRNLASSNGQKKEGAKQKYIRKEQNACSELKNTDAERMKPDDTLE